MGFVEVGGNGSVIWNIEHDDGDRVDKKGAKDGAHGKDKEPKKGAGGTFTIMVNGIQLATVDLDTSRILIIWGKSNADNVPNAKKNVPMVEPRSTV